MKNDFYSNPTGRNIDNNYCGLAVDDLGFISRGKSADQLFAPSVPDYKPTLTDLIERDITSIDIPDTVTSIGNYAFGGCTSLTTITIPSSVTSIGDSAFRNCTGLTTITIPDTVTSIGSYAFRSCTGLTSITIPSSVTTIASNTFNGCTNLTTITINKTEGSITGAPWGATNATIVWTG